MIFWASVLFVTLFRINDVDSGKINCEITANDEVEPFRVKFYLCTRENQPCGLVENESMDAEYLHTNGFDTNKSTIILIHGFLRNHEDLWVQQMKSALLKREPMNIVLVDWSAAYRPGLMEWLVTSMKPLQYTLAVKSIPRAGKTTSNFLRNVSHVVGIPLNRWHKLHFIGHSLGSHVSGMAAKNLKDVVDVDRITGLDPASPCFESGNDWMRLNRSDAKFVDVIHTNSEPGDGIAFGIYRPIGTIDFYPNGGNHQPGCGHSAGRTSRLMSTASSVVSSFVNSVHNLWHSTSEDLTDLIKAVLEGGPEILCNHDKAAEYFIQSLNSSEKRIFAVRRALPRSLGRSFRSGYDINHEDESSLCVELGIDADHYNNSEGTYFVNTTDHSEQCDELQPKNNFVLDE